MVVLRGAAIAALTLTAACATTGTTGGAAGGAAGVASYGGFNAPESVTYDAAGDRYFVANAGAFGPANDAFISIVNPDGTTATRQWVAGSDEKPFAQALGTAIHAGSLYVCDGNNIRLFDLETAAQTSLITIEGAQFLNDLDVAADGTVYVTDTGSGTIYRVTTDGTATPFVTGEMQPNGLELDADGNVVVVGIGSPALKTFSAADGSLISEVTLPEAGNDGIIVLPDAKIVSSVTTGKIFEVANDGTITTLAEGIPSAASIEYDSRRDRVVIPQLQANTLTFVDR